MSRAVECPKCEGHGDLPEGDGEYRRCDWCDGCGQCSLTEQREFGE